MTEANGQDDLDQLVHLSPRQAAAAEIIAAGGTQQDAAKQLGVARETVCRWHKHPEFTAVLNRHRSEALREHAAGIHRLRNSALDVVEGALDSNDTRVALRVLDTLGMSPASCGPTDARAIFDEEVRRISFDLPVEPPMRQASALADPLGFLSPPTREVRAYALALERLRSIAQDDDE